jgi:hypothetical protein
LQYEKGFPIRRNRGGFFLLASAMLSEAESEERSFAALRMTAKGKGVRLHGQLFCFAMSRKVV